MSFKANREKSIKINVVGDSGVGKSSLLHLLGDQTIPSTIYLPTAGCYIQIINVCDERLGNYTVELWEVGGSPKFKSSRSLFYKDCDGVIFVWDVSFEASYLTLNGWLDEIKQSETKNQNKCKPNTSMDNLSEYPNEGNLNFMLPLFIVGNKIDKLRQKDFQEIQKLNRQNILMSTRTTDFNANIFNEYFNEVFAMRDNRQRYERL